MDTDVRQTGRDIFKGEDCSEFHLMLLSRVFVKSLTGDVVSLQYCGYSVSMCTLAHLPRFDMVWALT